MKIQIDVPTKINKKLKIQKVEKDLKSIKSLLLQILEQWEKTVPDNNQLQKEVIKQNDEIKKE